MCAPGFDVTALQSLQLPPLPCACLKISPICREVQETMTRLPIKDFVLLRNAHAEMHEQPL